jgi:hypothetical protein
MEAIKILSASEVAQFRVFRMLKASLSYELMGLSDAPEARQESLEHVRERLKWVLGELDAALEVQDGQADGATQ